MRGALIHLTALVALAGLGTPALSWGPGVHLREADRVLEKVLAGEASEDWRLVATAEEARRCLHLGTLAPDFQWVSDSLTFGHAKALSYAVIAAAADLTPCHRMFALGHLTHIASDASAETFFAPTLWASHPLGPYDLFEGQDDALAETEGICEGVGDFAFGDWYAVVDLLFDFRLDGPEAWASGAALLSWYCEVGRAHHGTNTDCARVVAEVDTALSQADALLGGFSRADAHHLVAVVLDTDLVGFFELVTGGLLSFLAGGADAPSEHASYFRGLYLQSALVDDATWALYEERFVELAPHWTLEHLAHVNTTWPAFSGEALKSGNLQSMLQFLPEHFDPTPALRVDHVSWRTPAGATVSAATAEHDGEILEAHVRLFGALPFTGVVRGVVRKDLPGLDTGGPALGEATLDLDIDPMDYTTAARDWLVIPFEVELAGALGFTLELYADEAPRPWYTTSWDLLWGIEALELDRPIYRLHWGTYGRWPPSLPVAAPDVGESLVFVTARVAPAGPPLAGAAVTLAARDSEVSLALLAGDNGLARFDTASAGDHAARAEADGYLPSEPVGVNVGAVDHRWVTVTLHADLAPTAPAWASDTACVPLSWRADRTADQATDFLGRAVGAPGEEPASEETSLGLGPEGAICLTAAPPDGAAVALEVRAVYRDGSLGPAARSTPVRVDGSPPEVLTATLSGDGSLPCGSLAPAEPPVFRIIATFREPHAPLVGAAWRVGGEDVWRELPGGALSGPDGDARWALSSQVSAPASAALELRVVNAAGLATEAPLDRAVAANHGEVERCPGDPDGDVIGDDVVEEAEPDPRGPVSERLKGGGCGAGSPSGAWAALAGLALALAHLRRRRTGLETKSELVREGLRALVRRAASRRLAALEGAYPEAEAPPRRRTTDEPSP